MMIKEILKQWNIDDCPGQICDSVWSVKETLILKEYKDQKKLEKVIQLLKILHEAGIPVPEIWPLPDGKEFYEKNNNRYLMMTRLKGEKVVNMNQLDESWFFNFGEILAKLHIAFRECEKSMVFRYLSLTDEMKGWVTRELDQFTPETLTKYDMKEAVHQLAQVDERLPKQLIHRDVHLGNFLFEGKKFSGYIDFDLSQCNIRIFDVCYFLLGIRMDIENNQGNDRQWFLIVHRVMEGYNSLIKLKQIERQSVACVMKNIELLFMAYFLSIGDQKSAIKSADSFLFVRENEKKILEAVSNFSD